ncbi:MAG: 2-phospho-L-lactate transferase [Pseudomonadales bacterium]
MVDYLVITGGIGGAKLALGLSRTLAPAEVAFVVNTGDDFEHLGLRISPDIDTLVYTLAGLANTALGWGRQDESWQFMDTLEVLGGETWFRLGDRDLALHVRRTALLDSGLSLTRATRILGQALGVQHRILPMSDDPVSTCVITTDGPLAFQHYFVRDRCAPAVTGFEFQGLASAAANPQMISLLDDLKGIIICPSNPFVSVDPLLSLPGVKDALRHCAAPVVAVSPIIAGSAIKGPTAKMMQELGFPATAAQVAAHYGDLLDGFIVDNADADLVGHLEVPTVATATLMVTLADRDALARTTLEFIAAL